MTETSTSILRESAELLDWYDQNQRELPWRDSADPYQILVSEIMLQQTQVARVIPFFASFLKRFPTIEILARAEQHAVEAAWSGLGYYRRARQLHRAARQIVEDEVFPERARELRKLPGIGPYTAAAVASIAFGESIAVLDGNVERVLSRRLAFDGNPKRVAGRKHLERAALVLLDPLRPGDSNQALMELGATVCRPIKPRCEHCPLARGCVARQVGRQESFPRRVEKRQPVRLDRSLIVVTSFGKLLLFRRARNERVLPGQWEFPNCRGSSASPTELAQTYGGEWTIGHQLGMVRHTITFRALTFFVYQGNVEWDREWGETSSWKWVDVESLPELATSSLVAKVVDRFVDSSLSEGPF